METAAAFRMVEAAPDFPPDLHHSWSSGKTNKDKIKVPLMVVIAIYAPDKRRACSLLAQVPEATLPIPKDRNLLEEIIDREYEF